MRGKREVLTVLFPQKKGTIMKYVGVDLHKQSITVCAVNQARQVLERKRFLCEEPLRIREYFQNCGPCQVVVEATASYEWLLQLIEPIVERTVLAHPKKLRVIAESTRKSDKLDAQVLAEFLAMDMTPRSYRPTPRQRAHRRLVRQRLSIVRRVTSAKNRLRRILSDYNADRVDLFSIEGRTYLRRLPLSAADRFAADQILAECDFFCAQRLDAEHRIHKFAATAPAAEAEARALLHSIPGVGTITAEVVLCEIADIKRFRSAKHVAAYSGLSPGQRESAGKSRELHIEKQGSKYLRWVLVEAAWQLVRRSAYWKSVYENLKSRLRAKRAIVAVARRLLGVITAILKTGRRYQPAHDC
jgi:transposase